MLTRYFFIIRICLFLSAFLPARAALTIALVSDADREFYPMGYNLAKIRQACIKVHGEEWFKQNIIYERKYNAGSLYLSNTNFMEVKCRDAHSQDLIDLFAVLNYMAFCNDTLYLPVMKWQFDTIYNSKSAFDSYVKERTSSSLEYLNDINDKYHFLRTGRVPDIKSDDLNVVEFETFYLGNGCENNGFEYWEKCRKDGYMNLSWWHFDKEKVREEDISLYYEYIVAGIKDILNTRPKQSIPVDVHYDYNPNMRIVKIQNGNVFIEPSD